MRAIGIIPARMGSTRFPGKPLAELHGRPMVEWVYREAAATELLEPVFVATPDAEILACCRERRIPAIPTSAGCRNGTERVNDAMRQLAQRDPDEIVLNIQGDEPTIRPEALDALARAFNDPEVRIASLYFKPAAAGFTSDRNRVKVLVDEAGDALFFSRSILAGAQWRAYGQHVGIYAYRREILAALAELEPSPSLEQLAWMRAGYKIRMVELDGETVAVDTAEDLRRAEAALAARLRPKV